MIKAVAGINDRPIVILGLSEENTRRLHHGQPIPVSLRELHPDLPDVMVLLVAGKTEDGIRAHLAEWVQMPGEAAR